MKTRSALIAIFRATFIAGLAAPVPSEPPSNPNLLRGTQAGITGPNLIADESFESMDSRAFTLEAPFQVASDSHAHRGKADAHSTLSRSGKRIYSHVSVWKNTDYVSSLWLTGSGSGTLFVATEDLSQRLAATSGRQSKTTSWNSIHPGNILDSLIPRFTIGAAAHKTATSVISTPSCTRLLELITRSGTPTDSFGYQRARRTVGTATVRFISMAFRSDKNVEMSGVDSNCPCTERGGQECFAASCVCFGLEGSPL